MELSAKHIVLLEQLAEKQSVTLRHRSRWLR
jgi:hypothetical protein